MKKLFIALLLLSGMNLTGFEREKKVTFNTKAPTSTPTGSAIQRTEERASFDSIFEPKLKTSNCTNHCTCIDCLEKACCELDKIESKLPYLELIKKNKDEQSSMVSITAARMMAKIVALHKEGEKIGLVSKNDKDKSKSEKKSGKGDKKSKKEKTDPNLKKSSSSSRRHRLTTASDYKSEEELNQLTNPTQDSYKWRVTDAGLI